MAIQKLLYKPTIFNKFRDLINLVRQIFTRSFVERGVFIRYFSHHTHPTFFQYYNYPPPGKYSNFWNAGLLHWHNSPGVIDWRLFIIEVNDHPLSAVGYFENISEPHEVLSHLHDIAGIYKNKKCVKVIFPCQKMKHLFEIYFPQKELQNKFTIIHGLGCFPKVTKTISVIKSRPLKFLVICSDFISKGLDLVIDSWIILGLDREIAELTLVCHNIPATYIDKCESINSINIIPVAPLSAFMKHELLSSHDITIAPTHVHGGANIYEALEYGHAIIYTEYHSSVFEKIGIEIKMPYYFYSPNLYGVEWKTWKQFYEKLSFDKRSGLFNEAINAIGESILFFVENKQNLSIYSDISLKIAIDDYSLNSRNQKLNRLYSEFL
jgi:hypothetical protein